MKAWSYSVSALTVVPCFSPVGVWILFLAWTLIRKFLFPLKRAKFTAPLKALVCLQHRVLRVGRVRRLWSPCPQVSQGAFASCITAFTILNCSFFVYVQRLSPPLDCKPLKDRLVFYPQSMTTTRFVKCSPILVGVSGDTQREQSRAETRVRMSRNQESSGAYKTGENEYCRVQHRVTVTSVTQVQETPQNTGCQTQERSGEGYRTWTSISALAQELVSV